MKKLYPLIFIIITTQAIGQRIASGNLHSLFICADSTARGCGADDVGTLGDGGGFDKLSPVQVNGLTRVIAVAAGDDHSLFLKNDGTVWSCGQNQKGQLGDGTMVGKSTPVQVSSLAGIIAVSVGRDNSLFLKNDGTVLGCGYNGNTYDSIPVQINGLAGIVSISSGGVNSLFLKNDSTVWSCLNNSSTPIKINSLSGIVDISASAGDLHFLALKNDSTAWAWGDNQFGQLGDGTIVTKPTPVKVNSLSSIVAVSAGGAPHSLFLKSNGTVWGCGNNSNGQLGDGTIIDKSIPVQINSLSGIVEIFRGGSSYTHSLFLKNDGTVWACGSNAHGELGDGTNTKRLTPIQVTNLCPVLGVEENSIENVISIFPNPSSDFINVNYKSKTSQVQFEIIDVLGRKVTSFNLQGSGSEEEQINISKLSRGVYLLKVTDGDLHFARRFVKD